jgi:signal transduction histidine kinase
MTGYCGDVTHRKLGELALIESEKLTATGRLTASIAHEINNLLEALLNLILLLRGKIPGEEQDVLLDEATAQLQRVSEILRQILSFSRTSHLSKAPVSSIVETVLRILAPKLNASAISVRTQIENRSQLLYSAGEL